MLQSIILVVIGIFCVLKGADILTDGSVVLARKLNMSEMLIGLTIVAFGTSMPELCVSIVSALNGASDMALGNVVGSNIFNVFLIVGVCSIITPISVTRHTTKRDLPFAFIATMALISMLYDGELSRVEGIILLALFLIYLAYSIRSSYKNKQDNSQVETSSNTKSSLLKSPWIAIPLGLMLLVVGSDFFVNNASELAHQLGVSDAVIGITILGAGTSMPEFATSVIAASKGRTSMALGNVIGSCVFNILLILGLTSTITPLLPSGIGTIDIGVMLLGCLLMWLFAFTKLTLERWEGIVLTLGFIAYMTWLLSNV